jgi:4'-phosphopantetheinyl transferase
MPFYKKINSDHGWIGTWKLSETSKELDQLIQLRQEETERWVNMRSEKRKVEFLAARALVKMALGDHAMVAYNGFGKPRLKNSKKYLSISHSDDFACVFISDKKIGIDIEQADRNVERVASRFLHAEELKYISGLKDQQTAKIAYWSAKEAIFKCADEHGISFSKQIRIKGFETRNEQKFTGVLHAKNNTLFYDLHFHVLQNNVLVYGVELAVDKRLSKY